MATITKEMTVKEIADRYPASLAVLSKFDIDVC